MWLLYGGTVGLGTGPLFPLLNLTPGSLAVHEVWKLRVLAWEVAAWAE